VKILSASTYPYPQDFSEQWSREVFRPLRDHKASIQLEGGATIEAAAFELVEFGVPSIHACISTQAGCKFGCHFCSSGLNGFSRNLSTSEIVEEVARIAEIAKVSRFDHIVYMGIGEPLDNFDNVVTSIRRLNEDPWYQNKISLATVGVLPKLRSLARENLPLRMLWVSLHAATDTKRRAIMPIAQIYTVEETVREASFFRTTTGTETWINYMILSGFNDLEADAEALAQLLAKNDPGLAVMVTIPNGTVANYTAGTMDDVHTFMERLTRHGVTNRIARFFAAGRPLHAGCGEFLFHPQ
jgi:23S rRNA (adenine2503-C2)-methyltransferase